MILGTDMVIGGGILFILSLIALQMCAVIIDFLISWMKKSASKLKDKKFLRLVKAWRLKSLRKSSEGRKKLKDARSKKAIDDHGTKPEYDSLVARWRYSRTSLMLIAFTAFMVTPISFLYLIFGGFNQFVDELIILIGVHFGAILIGVTIRWFTVNVPEVQGLVVQNLLTGKLVVYGPGLHPRFPWESVHRTNHISLKDITITLPTETMPSTGALLKVRIQYRWKPRLAKLDVFYVRGISTVNHQFTVKFKEFFSSRFGRMDQDLAKKGQEILSWYARSVFGLTTAKPDFGPKDLEVEKDMSKFIDFEKTQGSRKKELRDKEDEFGICMMSVGIFDLDFDKKYQDSLDAKAESEKQRDALMGMFGFNPKLDEDKAKFQELMISKDPADRAFVKNLLEYQLANNGNLTAIGVYGDSGGQGANNIVAAAEIISKGGLKGKQNNPSKKGKP